MNKPLYYILFFLTVFVLTRLVTSCARMGQPDGGWYDEKPPYVVGAVPAENDTCVTKKKIKISFNEFIKIDNATENVLVSPPQKEQPEIKATGKNIFVTLKDSLIPNTTYTVDFSDAISDNNEGNPMGNYTFTFSTGQHIDTLECSGYVLEAENLEPIKDIFVGLYAIDSTKVKKEGLSDSANVSPVDSAKTFIRISRTDSRGHFVIKGIAPGRYTVGALLDQDNDYKFSQKAEKMAFSFDTIVPTCGPDTRQDTIWLDKNHIKDINVVGYTHFRPDNICLRAFTHVATDRYYIKADRTDANHFTLFFTAPTKDKALPELKLLNAPKTGKSSEKGSATDAEPFLTEHFCSLMGGGNLGADTITYWLRDTALVNQDTLQIEMRTLISDTLGILRPQTDTLEILAKTPYAKRLKAMQEKVKKWEKDLAKRLKRATEGEVVDTIMPKETLKVKYDCPSSMAPNGVISIEFPTPLERFDTAGVHLYVEQDSLWYRAPLTLEEEYSDSTALSSQPDSVHLSAKPTLSALGSRLSNPYSATHRRATFYTDWIPGANYSFEVDSLAFTDIYGVANAKYKGGIQVAKLEDFGSLFVNISNIPISKDSLSRKGRGETSVMVQLLDAQDNVITTEQAKNGTAEFYYMKPGTYYLRCFIDRNGNGVWDTGDYYKKQQPEEVYYNSEPVECKAKWDLTRNWNLAATPLYRQKPGAITKQKPEAEKTIKQRNAQRAVEQGVPLPTYLQ